MDQVQLFHEARHRLGEAIIWHEARACLYWIDLLDPALHHHDFKKATTQHWPIALKAPLGAIVATTDPDRLLVTHVGGLSLLRLSDMTLEPYCNPESGRDQITWNDAKCDRWGRLWAGTSHVLEREARGTLWCIESRTRMALGDAGFAISNGPAFSPDGKTLYFNDSLGGITFAYDIGVDDLHPRNRRALIRFAPEDGLPDGIIVDAQGCLWIAHWGGARISRHTPEGRLIESHRVPAGNVTTMCFAGPDFRTLYITTARDGLSPEALDAMPLTGSLFRLETDTKGLAEPLFRHC